MPKFIVNVLRLILVGDSLIQKFKKGTYTLIHDLLCSLLTCPALMVNSYKIYLLSISFQLIGIRRKSKN